MSDKISTLLSDVTIKGDVVEKEKLVTDSKIEGDITTDQLQTHEGAKITGNILNSSKQPCFPDSFQKLRSILTTDKKTRIKSIV